MVKEIPLQNGMTVLVDDEDFKKVSQHKWLAHIGGRDNGALCIYNSNNELLSKIILDYDSEKYIVVKKNNKPYDFRKENLVITEIKNRNHFSKGHRHSSSKYKGVGWNKQQKKWRARLTVNKEVMELGNFENEEDAAKAYNNAVIKFLGNNAFLNVLGEDNSAPTYEKNKVDQYRITKNKTKYKGVHRTDEGSFSTSIYHEKKNKHIGTFDTPEKAAKAYDKKAFELFGDKAILNFPNEVVR